MIAATATATVVPIQGTFDIAFARNFLRTKIAKQRWSMAVNARAAIALTALGELILLTARVQPVMVTIEILQDSDKCGVRLTSRFHLPSKRPLNWDEKKRNLKEATNNLDLIETEDEVEIIACIWVE